MADFTLILWQSSYILKSQRIQDNLLCMNFAYRSKNRLIKLIHNQFLYLELLITPKIQTTLSNAILSRRHSRVQTLVCIFFQHPLNLLVSRRHIILVLPLNMQVQLSTPNRHLLPRLHVHPSQRYRTVRLVLHLLQKILIARLLSRVQWVVIYLKVV